MAAIIKPLGNLLLTEDSTEITGESLYDADGANPLISVIVTNTVSTDGEF